VEIVSPWLLQKFYGYGILVWYLIDYGGNGMHIRTAVQADLAGLLAMYNHEVVSGTATLDLHPRTMEERQIWFDEHNVGNHPLITAEENGTVIGYASLSAYRVKEAYRSTVELSIYVHHEYRNRGVASKLMETILGMARADENTHMVVSVITSGNEASAALHKKFGFTHCGTIPEVGMKFGKYLDIDNYYLKV